MDLDFDFDRDRISDFLQSKLEEIKSKNANLEKTLTNRREVADALSKQINEDFLPENIFFDRVSKRICNHKYVIGVTIRKETDSNSEIINVILDWNSQSPLCYKYYLISSKTPNLLPEGLTFSNHLQHSNRLFIVLDLPRFDQLSYTISVSVVQQQHRKKTTLKLPASIQLTPQDVLDSSTLVQVYKMIDGDVDDFLACALANEKHEFVMVTAADWTQMPETKLGIDCSLSRVNLESKKKFFVAQKLSPLLDGTLVEVDEEFDRERKVGLNIYCRDSGVLLPFLHYLYKNIENCVIVPKLSYSPVLSLYETTQLIRDSLLNELISLENFSDKDLIKFRTFMADLEHKTDILMSRINEDAK